VCSSAAAGFSCSLLGCYMAAASCGNSLPTFRDDMAMRCPATSARNYVYLLGNIPEESSSAVLAGQYPRREQFSCTSRRKLEITQLGWICRLFERLSFQLDPCQRGRVVRSRSEADREKGKLHACVGSRGPVTQFVY
jgi:hypothetical protein